MLVKSVDKWLESWYVGCCVVTLADSLLESTFTYCKVWCAISNGLVC
jgi:hypothetical protein